MAQVRAVEFDIGQDAYGRPVSLRYSRTYDGKDTWAIHRAEANQRDNAEQVTGLTRDNLLALAEAVKDWRRG